MTGALRRQKSIQTDSDSKNKSIWEINNDGTSDKMSNFIVQNSA